MCSTATTSSAAGIIFAIGTANESVKPNPRQCAPPHAAEIAAGNQSINDWIARSVWGNGKGAKVKGGRHGKLRIHGASPLFEVFDAPAKSHSVLPNLPQPQDIENWLALTLRGYQGVPMKQVAYTLTFADDTVRHGTLDQQGFKHEQGVPPGPATVTYHNHPHAKDPARAPLADLLTLTDAKLAQQVGGDPQAAAARQKPTKT